MKRIARLLFVLLLLVPLAVLETGARRRFVPKIATAAGWNPSLYGTVSWWGAGDKLTGLNNGDPVSTFTDFSSNLNSATATGSNRPTFITSAVNGLPALEFDNSNNQMLTGSNFVTSGNAARSHFWVGKLNGNTNTPSIWRYGAYSGSANDWYAAYRFGGVWSQVWGASFVSGGSPDTSWHVHSQVFDGSTFTWYIDGQQIATASPTLTTAAAPLQFGNISGTEAGDGRIAEFVSYSNALNTANRQAVEDVLGTKYAITITH